MEITYLQNGQIQVECGKWGAIEDLLTSLQDVAPELTVSDQVFDQTEGIPLINAQLPMRSCVIAGDDLPLRQLPRLLHNLYWKHIGVQKKAGPGGVVATDIFRFCWTRKYRQ